MGYQAPLDGLRAISVIAVMLYHGGFAWVHGGFLGVEVFFVISGYLITVLLIEERRVGGTIALGGFWMRRARRLLPALATMLVAITTWVAVFGSDAAAMADAARPAVGTRLRGQLGPDRRRYPVLRARRSAGAPSPLEPRRRGAVVRHLAARVPARRACRTDAGRAGRRGRRRRRARRCADVVDPARRTRADRRGRAVRLARRRRSGERQLPLDRNPVVRAAGRRGRRVHLATVATGDAGVGRLARPPRDWSRCRCSARRSSSPASPTRRCTRGGSAVCPCCRSAWSLRLCTPTRCGREGCWAHRRSPPWAAGATACTCGTGPCSCCSTRRTGRGRATSWP